ncbi:MAG: LytTR family transcriptional regulator, partial [Saprospiraceae bacterium]|nr:LytTR family transcriptional regulator [Saprospiraceae bacterium]
ISKVARNKTMSSEKKVNIPANEVYVKSGHDHVRIVIDEISYIQSDTDYTEVHLAKSKILTSESLRNWLEILPDDHFVRVHKSYIVNTSHIRKVSGNELHLKQDVIIPIGRAFKETFIERFIK